LPLTRRSAPVNHAGKAAGTLALLLEMIAQIESLEDLATLSAAVESRAAALQPKKRKAK
jgi:hypothetical protein